MTRLDERREEEEEGLEEGSHWSFQISKRMKNNYFNGYIFVE